MPKPKSAKSSAEAEEPSTAPATKKTAKASVKGAEAAEAAKPEKAVKATKTASKEKVNGGKEPKEEKAEATATKKPKATKAEPPVPQVPKPLLQQKPKEKAKLSPFLVKQHERLLQLRDTLLDSMSGVAKDTLRSRAEGSEASAFGMHQADAGSDAYDRDFALSLLSQEQDALYEIEEALKRIEAGTYGVCEMSGKPIAHARLEALPFARYTVECQAQFEKQKRIAKSRTPVTSLFGLTDEESDDDGDEESSTPETKTKDED